jgi:predicted Zn-dependent protease
MRLFSIALSLLLATALAGTGCASQKYVRTETALAQALVSDQQSLEIGEQVHAELASQGVRYVADPDVTGYVQGVAARIFDLARLDRPGMDYHVHVIDDPKTVNAFATPGGHVYVYSGLLLAADNEAEMAGVLGHESGHVAGRHVERAMVSEYGLQALASLALGKNPSLARQLAGSVIGTGIMSAHSRSEETEADEYGARYVSRLGYDPNGMITFFQKLQAQESRTPMAMAWLRTHPVTADRISDLKDFIRRNSLKGTTLGEDRYRAIKQQVPRG